MNALGLVSSGALVPTGHAQHPEPLVRHFAPLRLVAAPLLAAPLAAALLLALTASLALAGPARAEAARSPLTAEVVKPAADTPQAAIVGALELIKAGNFDGFISKYCHKGKLCPTGQAKASLKRYNLPALQRLAPKCLKAGGGIEVTRVNGDPATEPEVKIFIVCDPAGMPRPFTLRNDEGGVWKHIRI